MTIDLDEPAPRTTAPSSGVAAVSKPVIIASVIQAVASVMLIVLLFFEWVRGGHLGLSGNGGAGFALLALATGVVGLWAVAMRWWRRPSWRLLGPSQLALMLAIALFSSNLLFLWVFRTGGAPKWVYVASNLLIYSGIVGPFSDGSKMAEQMEPARVRVLGFVTGVLGAGIAAAPMLDYTNVGGRSLSGYEPGAPRIGVLLLFIGGVTVFYGAQRARRTNSMHEVGPYVLWSHVTTGLGVVAAAPALAWVISGLWGNNFDAGVGAYVSVLLGIALIAVGIYESIRRKAPGI